MINLKGSKQEIIHNWKETYKNNCPQAELEDGFFENLFDKMYEYSPRFSEDEAFVILNEDNSVGDKLITPNDEYFISVYGATFLFITIIDLLLDNAKLSVAWEVVKYILPSILPENLANIAHAPAFKKIEKALGESCIMLEAFENRPDGIDKKILSNYKNGCVHTNFGCRFMDKYTGVCNCTPNKVDEILEKLCDEKLLYSKRRKYYYNDIF